MAYHAVIVIGVECCIVGKTGVPCVSKDVTDWSIFQAKVMTSNKFKRCMHELIARQFYERNNL